MYFIFRTRMEAAAAGKTSSSWAGLTTVPYEDGYEWRKYGEKKINGTSFTRSYFRCTYKDDTGCLATKHVQQKDSSDPPVFQVTYNNKHTCNNCTTTTAASKSSDREIINPHPPNNAAVMMNNVVKSKNHRCWCCLLLSRPPLPPLLSIERCRRRANMISHHFLSAVCSRPAVPQQIIMASIRHRPQVHASPATPAMDIIIPQEEHT
jgi:hypothetical protein